MKIVMSSKPGKIIFFSCFFLFFYDLLFFREIGDIWNERKNLWLWWKIENEIGSRVAGNWLEVWKES